MIEASKLRGVVVGRFKFGIYELRSAVREVLGLREYDIPATWQHMLHRVTLPFAFLAFLKFGSDVTNSYHN